MERIKDSVQQAIQKLNPGNTPSPSQETRLDLNNYEIYDVCRNIRRILAVRGVPDGFLDSKLLRPESYDPSHGYYLYGPVGVGKTHTAVAMMRESICRLSNARRMADIVRGIYDARFFPVTSLLMRIKDSFHPESEETEGDVIRQVTGPELVVIDDIGVEKVSDWTLQTLYTIIDTRSREKKQTIFTSNLSLDEIASGLSDRIASRIRGMCKVPEKMTGVDRRLTK